MDTIAAGLIAAGGDYPTTSHPPDDERLTLQAAVPEAFDRDKEGVQVQVEYCPIVHRSNLRQYYDYLIDILIHFTPLGCQIPDGRRQTNGNL
jgi:hypothetical protein